METDRIKEIKTAHPEIFAAKRNALGSDKSAAAVIQRQLEHDAANPPHIGAATRAGTAIAYSNAVLQMYCGARHGAELLVTAALALDPEAELPELEVPEDARTPALIAGNEMLMQQIKELNANRERDSNRIASLQSDLKSAQELLDEKDVVGVQDLVKKLRACSNTKEVRDVFAAFDAGAIATE